MPQDASSVAATSSCSSVGVACASVSVTSSSPSAVVFFMSHACFAHLRWRESVCVCLCLSVSVSVCLCLSLPFSACHYLSLWSGAHLSVRRVDGRLCWCERVSLERVRHVCIKPAQIPTCFFFLTDRQIDRRGHTKTDRHARACENEMSVGKRKEHCHCIPHTREQLTNKGDNDAVNPRERIHALI